MSDVKVYYRYETYAEIGPLHLHRVGDEVLIPANDRVGLRDRQAVVEDVDRYGLARARYLPTTEEGQTPNG